MITIKEIAELTGVSTTTVSHVIHGKTHKVSKNTIDKVQQALKAGGYVQRQGLEALTSRHARLVMAVVHTTRRYVNTPVSDPFFGQVIGAIEEELRACGYYLLLYIDSDIDRIFETALSWNVSGIIAVTISYVNYQKLRSLSDCPVVGIDVHNDAPEGEPMHGLHVTLDDYAAAFALGRYLTGCGIRDVLTLAEGRVGSSFDRWQGMTDALSGIPGTNERVTAISPSGRLVMPDDPERRHLLLRAVLPLAGHDCALFCTSDQLAFFVLQFLSSNGIEVPQQLSLCGFDDSPYAEFSSPKLTTMRQDFPSKGQAAVRLLLDAIDHPSGEDRIVTLTATLVVRRSVRSVWQRT